MTLADAAHVTRTLMEHGEPGMVYWMLPTVIYEAARDTHEVRQSDAMADARIGTASDARSGTASIHQQTPDTELPPNAAAIRAVQAEMAADLEAERLNMLADEGRYQTGTSR